MDLELNGRLISTNPDRLLIEKTILGLREEGSILTLSSGPKAFIQAAGSRHNGFIMTGQDGDGHRQYDQLKPIGTAEVILAFSAFLMDSPAWKQTVSQSNPIPKQKPGTMSGRSIFMVMVVIFIVVIGGIGFGKFMTARSGGDVPASEFSNILPVAIGIACYFGWLVLLFSWFRPRLASWLSNTFDIRVSENIISGSWKTKGPLWKKLLVFTIVMLIFIPATFLPLLVIGLMLIS